MTNQKNTSLSIYPMKGLQTIKGKQHLFSFIVERTSKKNNKLPFGGSNNSIEEFRFSTEEAAKEFYKFLSQDLPRSKYGKIFNN
tara:strand:+ start:765 stop:1016 length:252 start_codon:yes stop_codon:yes gene_type:complete